MAGSGYAPSGRSAVELVADEVFQSGQVVEQLPGGVDLAAVRESDRGSDGGCDTCSRNQPDERLGRLEKGGVTGDFEAKLAALQTDIARALDLNPKFELAYYHFDPAIKVAAHEVSRRNVDRGLRARQGCAIGKGIDAAVFEKTSHDADHAYVIAAAREAGPASMTSATTPLPTSASTRSGPKTTRPSGARSSR